MLLHQIINEIKGLRLEPNHRSSLSIFKLLDNNRALFLKNMDETDFNAVYSSFERLSEASAKEYGSASYQADFLKAHGLLMFYLDRIL